MQYLLDAIINYPNQTVPDVLNLTFSVVDARLSSLAQAGRTQSGCTAVTAFLRVEKIAESEPKGFTNPGLSTRGLLDGKGDDLDVPPESSSTSSVGAGGGSPDPLGRKASGGKRIRDFMKGLTGSGNESGKDETDDSTKSTAPSTPKVEAIDPKSEGGMRRVLYTANVGDARAVLR